MLKVALQSSLGQCSYLLVAPGSSQGNEKVECGREIIIGIRIFLIYGWHITICEEWSNVGELLKEWHNVETSFDCLLMLELSQLEHAMLATVREVFPTVFVSRQNDRTMAAHIYGLLILQIYLHCRREIHQLLVHRRPQLLHQYLLADDGATANYSLTLKVTLNPLISIEILLQNLTDHTLT